MLVADSSLNGKASKTIRFQKAMFSSDVEGAKALVEKYSRLREEIGKVIVGQDEIIHQTVLSIFCQGHVLLVGVPGLAKTLLVNTISAPLQRSSTVSAVPKS